jgi:hypothetical protein
LNRSPSIINPTNSTARVHRCERRCDHLAHHARLELRPELRHGRICTHPAGVGSAAAVENCLVILKGAERDRVLAVAQREERNFLAGQELLDDDAIARGAEASTLHRVRDRFQSRVHVMADDNAFPQCETVGLDDHRSGPRLHIAARRFRVVECGEVGGRDARLAHDRLGKRLTRFELRGGLGRPEYFQAGARELVDNSRPERIIGADDRQIDRLRFCELH